LSFSVLDFKHAFLILNQPWPKLEMFNLAQDVFPFKVNADEAKKYQE